MSSPVWEIYTEKNEVTSKAKCPYCFRWFSYKCNTSGLIRHLYTAHNMTMENLAERVNTITPSTTRFDINALRVQQAKFVVSCGLSYSVVENFQFRKYTQMLRVDAPTISSDTVRKDIMKLENDYRSNVETLFKGRKNLCLLMDGWTSANSNFQLYCVVVAHVDTEGKMRQQLIGVFDSPKTTAVDLHKLVSAELTKSSLSLSQFKFIVCDGGSNLKALADRTGIKRVYCANHKLHLIVSDLFKISDLEKILTKSRKIASALAKSSKTKSELRKLSNDLNIRAPIPQNFSVTRWNGYIDLLRSVKSQIPALAGIPLFAELLFNNRESLLMEFIIDYTRPVHEASVQQLIDSSK